MCFKALRQERRRNTAANLVRAHKITVYNAKSTIQTKQSTSRHLENEEKHQNESEGQSRGNTHANLSTGILYRRHSGKASLGQKTSIGDYITCTETHLTPAEIAAVKAQALTIVKEENFKHIMSGLDVNQPTLPHDLGSIFVTPPKILK